MNKKFILGLSPLHKTIFPIHNRVQYVLSVQSLKMFQNLHY